MKTQKIKFTRLLVLMALCCALIAESLFIPGTVAGAATKNATISETEMTIPIAKIDSKLYWNVNEYELSKAQKPLTVKNAVKGATYQYKSSDTKVATIDKEGGYLTGLKAGSATITCTQIYNNKKTTVGKCEVTVKNAGLTVNDYENEFSVGKGGYDLTHYFACSEPLFNITYRNPKATYTLTSDSKNFSIKSIKYDASMVKDLASDKDYQTVVKDYIGKRYIYGYQYTATKAGTYKVTVKETYNNKTRTLGSFKVIITK